MFESASVRQFPEAERKYKEFPVVGLISFAAVSRIFSLVLVSLFLVSAASNLAAEENEAKVPSIVTAEAVNQVTNSSLFTGTSSAPDWVRQGNYRDAGGADCVLVKANSLDLAELNSDMKLQMVAAMNQYIDSQLESEASLYISFDADDIAKNFAVVGKVHDESEAVSVGTGTMYTQYRQLRFDDAFRDHLTSRWTEEKSKFRVMQMSLVGGGVVVLLSIAFLFFRINHATRGFYAGRLQFFAMAVILAVVISGVFAGRLLPWY